MFPDAKAPRTPNFNTESDALQQNKPGWLKDLPYLNETSVAMVDNLYRRRVQSLQGVDEIVEDVVKKLDELGITDNTYSMFAPA